VFKNLPPSTKSLIW